MNSNTNVGKTLGEANPDLLHEILACLASMSISPACASLTRAQARRIASQLPTLKISRRCKCGDENCETYSFWLPDGTAPIRERCVRFYADGELVLDLDADDNVTSIERLYGDGNAKTVYALMPDGEWLATEIPGDADPAA